MRRGGRPTTHSSPGAPPAAPGALRGRDFRLLLGSSALSGLGDWLDQVALLVLVTRVWHDGANGLALIVSAAMLPLLATPFLAVLVDRRPSRQVLVLTDLAQALLTVGLALAPGVGVAAALVLARSALGSVGGVAAQKQLRVSAPAEAMASATAALQTAMQSVKILGPALGGVLVALMAPRSVIVVNAGTFVVSVLAVRALSATSPPQRKTDANYFEELRQGFRHVFRTPILRSLLFVMCCLMFVVFLYDSMAALIVPALGMGPSYIGYMVSAVGFGGVLGSLVMGRFATRLRPFATMAGATASIGCIIAAVGFCIDRGIRLDSAVWLCAIFLLGIASAGILVTFPSVVHARTPVELTGRVWALMNSVPALLNVIAPALAAALVSWLGLGWLLLLAGAALLLTGSVVAARLGGVTLPADPQDSGAPRRDTARDGRVDELTEEIDMADKMDKLAQAGFSLDTANEAQQAVLKSLSEDEIGVLLSVKSRLEAASSDVEGHAVSDPSGGYLW